MPAKRRRLKKFVEPTKQQDTEDNPWSQPPPADQGRLRFGATGGLEVFRASPPDPASFQEGEAEGQNVGQCVNAKAVPRKRNSKAKAKGQPVREKKTQAKARAKKAPKAKAKSQPKKTPRAKAAGKAKAKPRPKVKAKAKNKKKGQPAPDTTSSSSSSSSSTSSPSPLLQFSDNEPSETEGFGGREDESKDEDTAVPATAAPEPVIDGFQADSDDFLLDELAPAAVAGDDACGDAGVVRSLEDMWSHHTRNLDRVHDHFGMDAVSNFAANLGNATVMSLYSGLGGAEACRANLTAGDVDLEFRCVVSFAPHA